MTETYHKDRLLRKGLKTSHLRLLQALGEIGQLTAAAAAIGISQPAASRLVAEIERIIGHPVHERSGRGIEMTAIGRALTLRAQRVVIELDDAARDLAEIAEGGIGHIRIGTVTGAALDRVLPALQAERKNSPNVRIDVVVAASEQLCAQLLAGRLDFALGRIPQGQQDKGLVFVRLEAEPLVLIARRGHPLLQHRQVTAAEALTFDWVMPSDEQLLTRTVVARLQALGLPLPSTQISTSSFLMTLALLQHSNSIAAVARATAWQFAKGPDTGFGLVPVDLGFTVEPYGMLAREKVSLPPAALRLAGVIMAMEPQRG